MPKKVKKTVIDKQSKFIEENDFNIYEKYVDDVYLKMKRQAEEIPKWLSSVKKTIDQVIFG